jgi:hypothetical protein
VQISKVEKNRKIGFSKKYFVILQPVGKRLITKKRYNNEKNIPTIRDKEKKQTRIP